MNRHTVLVYALAAVLLSACAFVGSAHADGSPKRVLIVTTDPGRLPALTSDTDGEFIVADLTGAGYPFDVVTYSRFMGMSLDNHDVIFLSGHPSPTPLATVSAKCLQALQDGKRIFLNGYLCFRRYDDTGHEVEYVRYSQDLFGARDGAWAIVSGVPEVPRDLEKDPRISALSWQSYFIRDFSFTTPPAYTLKLGGKTVAFVTPQGGALDTGYAQLFNLLDYGKITAYLRCGNAATVGFANDRIEGKHIVSVEVHCDSTKDLVAIDAVDALARDYDVPLTNLLVYSRLDAASQQAWNSVSSPLMIIGSHSRTHPMDWPSVPDVLYQTTQAVSDQRVLIPSTIDFFNFSGSMNPTTAQIDQIYSSGLVFGASGYGKRRIQLQDGSNFNVQRMPTTQGWFWNLAKSSTTPFCLSYTLPPDYTIYLQGLSYFDQVKADFENNLRYGLYSFVQIHDLMLNPANNYYVQGTHMSEYIYEIMDYLQTQTVTYLPTEELIFRLRDFVAGSVDYETQPDGSLNVTLTRPNAKVNQAKIQCRQGLVPVASGASVLSQTLCGNYLYVDLSPEASSTFHVQFVVPTPTPPVLHTPSYSGGDITATWTPSPGPWTIVEYRYALGTTPGGSEIVDWTSSGSQTQCVLEDIPLQHGTQYFLAVKAGSSDGMWSAKSISAPITADLTPPVISAVEVSAEVGESVEVECQAADPDSPLDLYRFAVGTSPTSYDVGVWTSPNSTFTIPDGYLQGGEVYYVNAWARNAAQLWSEPVASGGISVAYHGNVAGARRLSSGTSVHLDDAFVTGAFDGFIYIEQPDRAAGIRVDVTGSGFDLGQMVEVDGTLQLVGGEQKVSQAVVTAVPGSGLVIQPLGMRCRYLGGSALNEHNPGVSQGIGLFNVGLLVRIFGKVTGQGDGCFYVSDGSVGQTEAAAAKVKWSGTGVPETGTTVSVTGVVSVEMDGESARPIVRPRTPGDITTFP